MDPSDSGDTSFVLVSSAMVFLMTPALAFFYGGFVSEKAVISTMMMSFSTLATISIAWSLIGYSLAFGPSIGRMGPWLGDAHFGVFDSSDRVREGTDIPEHAYMIFQLMFAIITAAVVSGGVAGRMRLWAWVVFSTIWLFTVYIPLARWVFYPGGWLAQWGVIDFAGGIPVETASGLSAFVLAFWLGPITRGRSQSTAHISFDGSYEFSSINDMSSVAQKEPGLKPHNVPYILLGAGLLFFGWFGFNAGSALSSGYLSSRAFANTHLAASAGMAGWAICEILFGGLATSGKLFQGRATAVGCATGTVVGLVSITPACGFVSQMFSILIGLMASFVCFGAVRVVRHFDVDDTLDCLPCHGIAGMFGVIATGFFSSMNEGAPVDGLVYGNPMLLLKQFVGLCVGIGMTIVGTTIAYFLTLGVGKVAGALMKVSPEVADYHELGERAYYFGTDDKQRRSRSRSLIDTLLGA